MLTIKSVPVASFVVIALIWFDASGLSTLISFLMVLTIVYTNLLEGKFGIKIQSIIENGKLPDGIQFIYNDTIYYPQSKNKYVIIPLTESFTGAV